MSKDSKDIQVPRNQAEGTQAVNVADRLFASSGFTYQRDIYVVEVPTAHLPKEACGTKVVALQLHFSDGPLEASSLCDIGKDELTDIELPKIRGYEDLSEDSLAKTICVDTLQAEGSLKSTADTTQISIVKFDVFLENADVAPRHEGMTPIWKWAKPQSNYGRLEGAWSSSLRETIYEGTHNAGADLMILLRWVDAEQLEELRSAWREGTRVIEYQGRFRN